MGNTRLPRRWWRSSQGCLSKSDRFTVFLRSPGERRVFYVRRPDYYFSFAGGRRRENQRMGLAPFGIRSWYHPLV